MALGLAQLWHYIYDFQLVWDMAGKQTRIMAGKDKSRRYFSLKIPQMKHGFQSQQLYTAHCSHRYIADCLYTKIAVASKRFVCFAARDRKRRFGCGPPPTTLSSSLLVYLSTSSLHLPPLFTPAASIAHSLRYVYIVVLPGFVLVACFCLSFYLLYLL